MTYTFITHLVLLCRRFGNKYGLTSTIGAFFIFVNKYPYFSIIGFYSHACKANAPSPLLIFLNPFFTRFTQPYHCFFSVHVKFLLLNCTFTVKHFIKYTSKLIKSFRPLFIVPLQFRYIVPICFPNMGLEPFFFVKIKQYC